VAVGEVGADLSGHWLILQPPESLERWFSPPISRAELAELYPGAALFQIPDANQTPNGEQKAELTALVGLVATAEGFSQAEHTEALARALLDPESALVSFRALARELGLVQERSTDTVRLWLTVITEQGEQRIALEIPCGKYDGMALLEMFEKHRAAGTTKITKLETEQELLSEARPSDQSSSTTRRAGC
jgi:hypothetical protein